MQEFADVLTADQQTDQKRKIIQNQLFCFQF